jgi:toxin CptA
LLILGVMGAFSAWASEMPRAMAVAMAVASVGYGVWLARCEARRIPRMLVWPIGGTPLMDDVELRDARLQRRGPLAFLQWRSDDGRIERLSWWVDTLPAHERRELALAAAGPTGARKPSTMAP